MTALSIVETAIYVGRLPFGYAQDRLLLPDMTMYGYGYVQDNSAGFAFRACVCWATMKPMSNLRN